MDRFERFSLAFFEISKLWHKLAAEEMKKYDLKGPHCVYLLALARNGEGLTAPRLCEECGKDKSDVSRMMAIMEARGLVQKDGGHQNRYGGVFHLTRQGKEVAEQIRRRAGQAVEFAGRDLSEEQRGIFYDALESIAANLRWLRAAGIPDADTPEINRM